MSESLWPHELQHARAPCPSPAPGVCSNSCPSNRWCHPTILSSVTPFSSCPQSFPVSGSFQMNQFFTSGGQSIGASILEYWSIGAKYSASVFPMNIQDWLPLGWTGWISFFESYLRFHFYNYMIVYFIPFNKMSFPSSQVIFAKFWYWLICICCF